MNEPKISKLGDSWMCDFVVDGRQYRVVLKQLQSPSTTLRELADEHRKTADDFSAAAAALAGWKP